MDFRRREKQPVGIALLVAVLAVSFAAIFFRKSAPTPPMAQASVRLAVAACVLLPATLKAWRDGRLNAPVVWSAVLAGILYGLHFGAWVTSLSYTSVAASVTLVTTTPIVLGGMALLTGRDRPDGRLWMAIGMGLCGMLLIGWHDWNLSKVALFGDGLALLGMLAVAGYMTVVRRLGDDYPIWAFSGIATAVGAVLLSTATVVTGQSVLPVSLESFFYLVLAALVPQLIGHTLLTWSLRYATPTLVAMAVVGEPAGSTLLAWLWLGEGVAPRVAIGCGVTLFGVVWATLNRGRLTNKFGSITTDG